MPAASQRSTSESATARPCRSERRLAMIMTSMIDVRCRTSKIRTFSALRSASTPATKAVTCCADFRLRLARRGIAMSLDDDAPHSVGKQILGLDAGADGASELRRRHLELGHGLDVNLAGRRFAKLVQRFRPVAPEQLTDRPGVRRAPPRRVRDYEMREIEQSTPLVPRRELEEGIHAEQQAQRRFRQLGAQAP